MSQNLYHQPLAGHRPCDPPVRAASSTGIHEILNATVTTAAILSDKPPSPLTQGL